MNATAKWFRGVDDLGRIFTFAIAGDTVSAYFPNIDAPEFELSDRGRRSHGGPPVQYWRDTIAVPEFERWKKENHVALVVASSAIPGQYFPRIYRGRENAAPDAEARNATVRVARALFERLEDVFKLIEPVATHQDVFGHELRHLLILAATEVESAWKAVLRANHYPGDRWTTRDYVRLQTAMKLDAYAVKLAGFPSFGEVVPFAGWSAANPTESLPWYSAYNANKHNREVYLKRATLGAAIDACAAVHIMAVAQFGSEHVDHREFHHSDIFAVTRHWRWLEDAYIRPLAAPEAPLARWPEDWTEHWPREWVAEDYSFTT